MSLMRRLTQLLAALVATILVAFSGVASADDDDDDDLKPTVSTVSAQPGPTDALLKAKVHPHGGTTTVVFHYATATAYKGTTAPISISRNASWTSVSARVEGLEPEKTYFFVVEAKSSNGTTRSSSRSFTTLAAPAPTPTTPTPAPPSDDAVEPELGKTVAVAPRGRVLVRLPGDSGFAPLASGAELPVGTAVDARDGQVALTSALPSGKTQTGRFGGGRFVVRQRRHGLVNLFLRGRACAPSAEAGSATAVAAGKRKRRGGRRLWGSDRGGRFRTHGRNSHATVRGTRWVVKDRCDGSTVTRVTEGAVVVRDKVRSERIVVRAGERYVARPRR